VRPREIFVFAGGLVLGAFLFYMVAWRTGALTERSWLTRTSQDIRGTSAAPLPPIATIPFRTPVSETPVPGTPVPGMSAAPSPLALTPSPVPSAAGPSATSAAGPPGLDVPAGLSTPVALRSGEVVSRGFAAPSLAPLLLPVLGARVAQLKDNFDETRGGTRRHEAIDILAPRGTAVLATVEGTVAKLFTSVQGGLTIYEFDRAGTYCYYYAHLDRYAPGLAEGAFVHRGDRIGDVGTSGNAPKDTPHLHFAIFRLGPEKHWWQGEPVNPYPLLLRAEER
jgi:murein DD-endopeptidase MepM/ murein hydrolase activator NlpD